MLSGLLLVLGQVLLLLLSAAGWGWWVWVAVGLPPLMRRQNWVWLGFAGFATHALLLQGLVYSGLPLKWTAWPVFLVGAFGVLSAVQACRSGFMPEKHARVGGKPRPTGFRRARGDAWLYALVLAAGFAGQAPALVAFGPARYFGNGHYDQANYVVTAEFLTREKFATTPADVGHRPWMLRALEAKEQRITECVVLGAVAVTSGSDCQQAYGAVGIFLVALAGVATAAWLRSMSLPRWAAAAAGLGAALSPAFTRIHLDGFFSQTASLWVYPALAGLLGGRGAIRKETRIIAALLLAYLVGTYTEIGVFGVALAGLLMLSARQPLRKRWVDLAAVGAIAVLVNLGYIGRLVKFAVFQWERGSHADLAALFPEGGSLLGWGRMFVDEVPPTIVVITGAVIVLLVAWGLAARKAQRPAMFLVAGVALGPLVVLRMLPGFSPYVFAKLAMQFMPVWLGAAVIGVAASCRPGWLRAKTLWVVPLFVLGAMLASTWHQQKRVMHPEGTLAVLSSARMADRRREVADGHPRLVANADPLVAQWLCYFARNNDVVLDRRNLGDRVVTTETNAFRRWTGGQLWWLDPDRAGPLPSYESPPRLEVGIDGKSEANRAVHEAVDFALTRQPGAVAARTVWLDFLAVPLTPCVLEMGDEAGRIHRTTLLSTGWRRWQLTLPPGRSSSWHLAVRPLAGELPPEGLLLLKSFSVEKAPGVAGLDPEPVETK